MDDASNVTVTLTAEQARRLSVLLFERAAEAGEAGDDDHHTLHAIYRAVNAGLRAHEAKIMAEWRAS